jgi:hypothetical protein
VMRKGEERAATKVSTVAPRAVHLGDATGGGTGHTPVALAPVAHVRPLAKQAAGGIRVISTVIAGRGA